MFTGLVEEKGTILKISQNQICVKADKVLEGSRIGDSIAVNGVCLTVTRLTDGGFWADVMPETFSRSNLGSLTPGPWSTLNALWRLTDALAGTL